MLFKSAVAAVYLASVASATFFPMMPHCWKKCARNAGLMCNWADLDCLCKAANNGFMVQANTCACKTCEDWEWGNDDKLKLQLKELTFACKHEGTPLDAGASSAAFQAGTCEGSSPQPQGGKPWPKTSAAAPPPPVWSPSAPPAWSQPPPPPPFVPAPGGAGIGGPPPSTPPVPSAPWGGAPGGLPSGTPPSPISLPYSSTLTVVVPPKPTPYVGPPAPVVAPAYTPPPTPPSSVYPASPAGTKTWAAGVGVIGSSSSSEGPWSTATIQSTVLVSPTPAIPLGGAKATTSSSATKAAATSVKPSQFAGSAPRPDFQWAGSMLGLAAGVIFVIA